MQAIPELLVAGIPLIIVIFALVEEVKAYGVQGKILRVVSLGLGFGMAFLVQLGAGMPADTSAWITTGFVGLVYGLTASGAYDFLDGRMRKVS